jgi:hypothetical protein
VPPAKLPEAKIVDRETSYEKASKIGLAIVGAVFTMWSELGAVALPGLAIGDLSAGTIRIASIVAVPGCGGLGFLPVRRIVRPSTMRVHLRGGWLEYPSTSWAHAVFDVGYAALGALLLTGRSDAPGVDGALVGGLACMTLTGALLVLRLVYWRRQRELA